MEKVHEKGDKETEVNAKETLRLALVACNLLEDMEVTEEEKQVGSDPEEENADDKEDEEASPPSDHDDYGDDEKDWGSEMEEDEEAAFEFLPEFLDPPDSRFHKEVLLGNFNNSFPKDTTRDFAARFQKLIYSSSTGGKTLVCNKESYRRYMEKHGLNISVNRCGMDLPIDPSPKGVAVRLLHELCFRPPSVALHT